MKIDEVIIKELAMPICGRPPAKPELPDKVYGARLKNFREIMKSQRLDCVVVYADREHYANFRYFAGFEPRFEEALLILHVNDPSYLILGNEIYPMHDTAKLPSSAFLYPVFSLPNQPMENYRPLDELLTDCGLKNAMRVGLVGWKLFSREKSSDGTSEIPSFIVDSLRRVAGESNLAYATGALIDPEFGLRVSHGLDEIAVLEYGASCAAFAVYNALTHLREGLSEEELADFYLTRGAQHSCHPMALAGKNLSRGIVSPGANVIKRGDGLIISVGLEGGLTCREGYVAESEEDLPLNQRDYVEKLAKPYFAAIASWYERIGANVTGGEIFELVDGIIPKSKFGWQLNPGHLSSTEEWLSSPIYPGSDIKFKSGSIVQMDIIPSLPPYCGVNAEDGICIADESLRKKISSEYPQMWERMQRRRKYMRDVLGIALKPDILPMSDLCGFYSPFLLRPSFAFSAVK
jgi:Xaa-Pro aminopeptidase